MTTCPSCKRDQVQSSAFCAYCGAVLDRPVTSTPPQGAPGSPDPKPAASPPSARARVQAPAVAHDTGDIGAYIVRRLLALAVDIAIVGTLIAIALRTWLVSTTPDHTLTMGGFVELVSLIAAALFVYRWLFEGCVGSTLGKLVFGLAVGRNGGGSIGLGRSFVRNLLLPVDLALVGFLVAAITPQRRRIGDLVAGTVVANARIGALAPIVGIVLLGAAAYGVNAYAGGLSSAQHLAQDASQFAPALIGGASPTPTLTPTAAPTLAASPAPEPTPTPESTPSPAPTPSPTREPTARPSESPSPSSPPMY